MKFKPFIFPLAIIVSLSSCNGQDQIYVLELSKLNPTTHIFNFPLDALKDTVVKLFSYDLQRNNKYLKPIFSGGPYVDHGGISGQQIFDPRRSTDSFPNIYFQKEGRDNDIFLFALTGTWGSMIYFTKNKPMQFQSSFILHLKKIGVNKTLLSIEADSPFVVNGMDGFGAHGPKKKQHNVRPTTVEEYSLILYIASRLGEKNLPPLVLPQKKKRIQYKPN